MPHEEYTFCSICEQCCGLEVTVDNGRVVKIRPDQNNPYSWEDFCIKGASANEVLYHPQRITTPMKKVGKRYVSVSYEQAVAEVSQQLRSIIDDHGASAIASYCGNPQGFSFSNPILHNAFMDAIGSDNRYWVGSIDQNSWHVVSELMFGSEWVSLIPDVDKARCALLLGTNPAVSGMNWAAHVSNGWKRTLAAKENGAQIIIVDPYRTASAAKATSHIAIRPEQDWAFLLGIIKVVFDNGWAHEADCTAATGVEDLKRIAQDCNLEDLAGRCEIPVETIIETAKTFATAETGYCVARTGVSQGANGSLGEWLSQALNVITGRLDRPGGRVFNPGVVDLITMGEGMFASGKRKSRVRGLDSVAGAFAVAELPGEITTPGPGKIRAMIINCGNPVTTGPGGPLLDSALEKLDLLIAIDLVQRESHRHAHWLIPGSHFLERSEFNPLLAGLHDLPFAQSSRAVAKKPANLKEEWEFYVDLALAMNKPLFGRRGVNSAIRFSQALAKLTGSSHFSFSPRWLAWLMVRIGGKVRWSEIQNHPHGFFYEDKQYGALKLSLKTPDKKIHVCPQPLKDLLQVRLLEKATDDSITEYPMQIISQRRLQMMNSWLSDTSGKNLRPFKGDAIEIHPEDAADLGVECGQLVRVRSASGALDARVLLSDKLRRGVANMEHGWGSRVFDATKETLPKATGVNRNILVNNTDLDPLTSVPRFNGTRVRIESIKPQRPEAN